MMQIESDVRHDVGKRERETTCADPDAVVAVYRAGVAVGQCSCWWNQTPSYRGARTGVIGGYAAMDAEAAAGVLSQACDHLRREGCAIAIGPIDGSTWRSYRFIVERGSEPLFFLEPDSPDIYPGQWTAFGFAPFATYTSALSERLDVEPAAIARASRRLSGGGISIRSLDLSCIDDELQALYALSTVSFRRNFLYTPIGFEEFRQQYLQVLPIVRPELVLIAQRAGAAVGFAFGIPDVLQARRTGSTDTAIVKTVAVHPSIAGAGVGGVLLAEFHRRAYALGFRRAIHALMHDGNTSRGVSGRFARPFRRYALFAKPLVGSDRGQTGVKPASDPGLTPV